MDGVLLCAPGRARFSMRLSGEMPREAECECDLAQLMAEAPSDAIQEVVVPCTEVGGQRTLCRLWVRLFRARSRGAARLEYEIACLARQKAEVRRAGGGAEEGHLRPRHAAESLRFRADDPDGAVNGTINEDIVGAIIGGNRQRR